MKAPTKMFSGNFMKWVTILAAFKLSLQIGFFVGWPSPNIAWLLSEESTIPMTTSDISWMMSLTMLGGIVGAIVGSILIEYLGSRKTVLATFLLSSVSWMCLLFAKSANWIIAARFTSALPCAMFFGCYTLYLSEVTDRRIRGTAISLASIGMSIGMLLGLAAESYLPKSLSTSIYLTQALLGAAIFGWLRDTPYTLARKDDDDGVKKSVEFYHEVDNVKEELDAVRSFVAKNECMSDKLTKLRLRSVRKSLFVVCLLFGLLHLTGVMAIMSYMEVIVTKAKISWIEPAKCVIYGNVISVVGGLGTVRLMDQLGRRILVGVSSIGMVVSLILLGFHFHLIERNIDAENLQWLPMISLITLQFFFSTGYGLVPTTLLSEMFPESIKGLATFAATLSASFSGFVVMKGFQTLIDAIGYAYVFWIFAGFSALGIPLALFFMIETKGKTFRQIQDELGEA